ncbi:hypothetical protein H1R20_g9511, partial [Candolleomyces eurysporus]
MVTLLKVYIVRHGETAANKDGVIQGQLDTQLNEEGIRQAGLLAERLKDVPFRLAFTSDLQRAKKTAEIVLAHHPGVELQERKELRERFMGSLQGTKLPSQVRKAALRNEDSIETGDQMRERAIAWWNEAIIPVAKQRLKEHGHGQTLEPLNVLAASHGGLIAIFTNAAVLEGLAQAAPGVGFGRCWNTAISIIEVDESLKGRIVKYGDISHLLQRKVDVVDTNVDEVETDSAV